MHIAIYVTSARRETGDPVMDIRGTVSTAEVFDDIPFHATANMNALPAAINAAIKAAAIAAAEASNAAITVGALDTKILFGGALSV